MTTDTDQTDLQRIAEQYASDGFQVIAHPKPDELPIALSSFAVDLLATRGRDHVIVSVKRTRTEFARDSEAQSLAAAVHAEPNCQFDLVILERESPLDRIAEHAEEPDDGQLNEMIEQARQGGRAGLTTMALVPAWAILESAMRRLRGEAELSGGTAPMQLASTLYGNGFLSRPEFLLAKQAWTLRSHAVHGFVGPPVEPQMIEDVLALANKVAGLETHQPA